MMDQNIKNELSGSEVAEKRMQKVSNIQSAMQHIERIKALIDQQDRKSVV